LQSHKVKTSLKPSNALELRCSYELDVDGWHQFSVE